MLTLIIPSSSKPSPAVLWLASITESMALTYIYASPSALLSCIMNDLDDAMETLKAVTVFTACFAMKVVSFPVPHAEGGSCWCPVVGEKLKISPCTFLLHEFGWLFNQPGISLSHRTYLHESIVNSLHFISIGKDNVRIICYIDN